VSGEAKGHAGGCDAMTGGLQGDTDSIFDLG
jgi:hypothetical protein